MLLDLLGCVCRLDMTTRMVFVVKSVVAILSMRCRGSKANRLFVAMVTVYRIVKVVMMLTYMGACWQCAFSIKAVTKAPLGSLVGRTNMKASVSILRLILRPTLSMIFCLCCLRCCWRDGWL